MTRTDNLLADESRRNFVGRSMWQARQSAPRGPGDSYSDVILRLAAGERSDRR
jgi:hypothetical protein